jgi:hypothetical protein
VIKQIKSKATIMIAMTTPTTYDTTTEGTEMVTKTLMVVFVAEQE